MTLRSLRTMKSRLRSDGVLANSVASLSSRTNGRHQEVTKLAHLAASRKTEVHTRLRDYRSTPGTPSFEGLTYACREQKYTVVYRRIYRTTATCTILGIMWGCKAMETLCPGYLQQKRMPRVTWVCHDSQAYMKRSPFSGTLTCTALLQRIVA